MPIRTHVIDAATVLDTDQIMALFGIPKDTVLLLTGLYYASDQAAGAYLDMAVDIESGSQVVEVGDDNSNQNKFRLWSNGADLPFRIDIDDFPLPVQNKIVFTPSAGTWTITFVYDKSETGSMDLTQENLEVLEDIVVLGGQMGEASAGKEFYQVGDRTRVGA